MLVSLETMFVVLNGRVLQDFVSKLQEGYWLLDRCTHIQPNVIVALKVELEYLQFQFLCLLLQLEFQVKFEL